MAETETESAAGNLHLEVAYLRELKQMARDAAGVVVDKQIVELVDADGRSAAEGDIDVMVQVAGIAEENSAYELMVVY
jgi:hypothetical protein